MYYHKKGLMEVPQNKELQEGGLMDSGFRTGVNSEKHLQVKN